jgi:carboxylesterase type B
MFRHSLLTALSALSLLEHSNAQGSSPSVTLNSGTYEGLSVQHSSKTIHKYLAIPFANPPIRFGVPKPANASTEKRKAVKLAPACIQNNVRSSSGGSSAESEDCLYLNVYAPADTTTLKPVLFWLFGGGLQYGSASVPTYDGTSFAANHEIVLVAPNYRVNVFGFPGPVPGLPKDEQNLGFLDQKLALQWVQDNIAKFGGDKDKVTIFGESAGARSVDFQILSSGPPQKPMFRGAIMQSGSASLSTGSSPGAKSSGGGVPQFLMLGRAAGCTVPETAFDCMRKVPVDRIKRAMVDNKFSFGATWDGGRTVALDAEKARAEKKVANVPLMIGTNANEAKGSLGPGPTAKLESFLDQTFGDDETIKDQVRRAYPLGIPGGYNSEADAAAAISTDLRFTCMTSREAYNSAATGYRKSLVWSKSVATG